jgi:hypothetical protein
VKNQYVTRASPQPVVAFRALWKPVENQQVILLIFLYSKKTHTYCPRPIVKVTIEKIGGHAPSAPVALEKKPPHPERPAAE